MALRKAITELLQQAGGRHGHARVTAGTTETGTFSFVKAMNGDVTFGPGCVAAEGDGPSDGDVLREGDVLPTTMTAVEVKGASGGVAYAFHDSEQ